MYMFSEVTGSGFELTIFMKYAMLLWPLQNQTSPNRTSFSAI